MFGLISEALRHRPIERRSPEQSFQPKRFGFSGGRMGERFFYFYRPSLGPKRFPSGTTLKKSTCFPDPTRGKRFRLGDWNEALPSIAGGLGLRSASLEKRQWLGNWDRARNSEALLCSLPARPQLSPSLIPSRSASPAADGGLDLGKRKTGERFPLGDWNEALPLFYCSVLSQPEALQTEEALPTKRAG